MNGTFIHRYMEDKVYKYTSRLFVHKYMYTKKCSYILTFQAEILLDE